MVALLGSEPALASVVVAAKPPTVVDVRLVLAERVGEAGVPFYVGRKRVTPS